MLDVVGTFQPLEGYDERVGASLRVSYDGAGVSLTYDFDIDEPAAMDLIDVLKPVSFVNFGANLTISSLEVAFVPLPAVGGLLLGGLMILSLRGRRA